VRGLRHALFDKEPTAHVYVPFGYQYHPSMNLHVRVADRARGAETALINAVRHELREVDEHLPVLSIMTLRRNHENGLMLWLVRTGARLFTVFGALALFLAVVGVYGVKAYVVARRTREIGIRMALGATGRDVLWLVLREGTALTLAGVGVGLLLALATGRLLSSKLYEVSATDPLTFVSVPALLMLIALASTVPAARRAAGVEPMAALREE
jgi:putative ABC transport system permease protein